MEAAPTLMSLLLLPLLLVLGIFFGLLVWTIFMQRGALKKQQEGLNSVEVSLAMQRDGLRLGERQLEVLEKIAERQDEIIQALRQFAQSREPSPEHIQQRSVPRQQP